MKGNVKVAEERFGTHLIRTVASLFTLRTHHNKDKEKEKEPEIPLYQGYKPAYGAPKPSYDAPKPSYEPTYFAPRPSYGAPKPSYGAPKILGCFLFMKSPLQAV